MLGRSAQMGTFRETIMLEGFLTPAIGYSLIWRYTTIYGSCHALLWFAAR